MRISDEQRREVARKLRGLPIDMYSTIDEWEKDGLFINNSVSDEGDYSQIHDAVFGYFPAEYMHPGDYEELHERLADLIDRPTCTIVNSWQEITPGLGELDLSDMCGFELSCGHEVNGYEKPHYCSECGAVVVDED